MHLECYPVTWPNQVSLPCWFHNGFEQRRGTFSKPWSGQSPGISVCKCSLRGGPWIRSTEKSPSLPDPGQGKAPGSWIYLYLTKCNFLFPRGSNEGFDEELKSLQHSSDHKRHFDELSANKTKSWGKLKICPNILIISQQTSQVNISSRFIGHYHQFSPL